MNVRKFVAENSRLAMRQVKLELGEDAVILSTRKVPQGMEVMAVAMGDMMRLQAAADEHPAAAQGEASFAEQAEGAQTFVDFARQRHQGHQSEPRAEAAPAVFRSPARSSNAQARSTNAQARSNPAAPRVAAAPASITTPIRPKDGANTQELMSEIRSMRTVLETQLASLAWSDSARRAPVKTRLASQLLEAGFSAGLCRAVAARLPDDYSAAQAESWLASIIEANIRKAAPDELVNQGGVYALVGPTGVGKTTTTAKLAARYVMKHGAQRLGLISADSYRIGAQDQLRTYGRILGVPVHAVQDAAELHATLAAMRDKHLVLIDTIGVSQRDERVAEQVVMLGAPGIKRLLMLNAACHAETLEDVVQAYGGLNAAGANAGGVNGGRLHGCCISKLDEAMKPGTVLDTVIRHKLPLHFVSTGQRVPEDLHLPNVSYLVHSALKRATSDAFRLSQDDAGLLIAPNFSAQGFAAKGDDHAARG
ncbi:MAG TPA: flagellar biosynthesis protein FlhF [Burkholderiales bacterium]|nr:flagellar biosynthesis protein FlhF [Burkholderiales bacterium]